MMAAWLMSAVGQSLPSHSAPVPANVRHAPKAEGKSAHWHLLR
jgi:hypothetical protein